MKGYFFSVLYFNHKREDTQTHETTVVSTGNY